MSFYRRFKDGTTERWMPEENQFVACERDEPETRQRGPNEGMIVAPGEECDSNVIPISVLKKMLLEQMTEETGP